MGSQEINATGIAALGTSSNGAKGQAQHEAGNHAGSNGTCHSPGLTLGNHSSGNSEVPDLDRTTLPHINRRNTSRNTILDESSYLASRVFNHSLLTSVDELRLGRIIQSSYRELERIFSQISTVPALFRAHFEGEAAISATGLAEQFAQGGIDRNQYITSLLELMTVGDRPKVVRNLIADLNADLVCLRIGRRPAFDTIAESPSPEQIVAKKWGEPITTLMRVQAQMEPLLIDLEAARTKLAESNIRLTASPAKSYTGLPFADLAQAGMTGLMHAVDSFDPERGNRFSTYASWWIRQAVQRAFVNERLIIGLPLYLQAAISKLWIAEEKLFCKLQRNPTTTELAEHLGLKPRQVNKLLEARKYYPQNGTSPNGEPTNPIDYIEGQSNQANKADQESRSYSIQVISEANRMVLNSQEQCVLELRHNLHISANPTDGPAGADMTLEQVGEELGVTRERVRQIEVKYKGKIFDYCNVLMNGRPESHRRALSLLTPEELNILATTYTGTNLIGIKLLGLVSAAQVRAASSRPSNNGIHIFTPKPHTSEDSSEFQDNSSKLSLIFRKLSNVVLFLNCLPERLALIQARVLNIKQLEVVDLVLGDEEFNYAEAASQLNSERVFVEGAFRHTDSNEVRAMLFEALEAMRPELLRGGRSNY